MEAGSLAQRQPGQTADQAADQFNAVPIEGPMTYESFLELETQTELGPERAEQMQTLGSRVLEFAQSSVEKVSEEAHSLGNRVSEIAHNTADKFGKLRTSARENAGVLATSAVALLGGATYVATNATEAIASEPAPATLKYVDKAKLALARDVIKTFRHTKPSNRHVTRHTNAYLGGYQNVTEILAQIPAKAAGNRHVTGEYAVLADFKGAIKPKNMVAAGVSAVPNNNNPGTGYQFLLARTTHDGPTTVMPMHWFMSNEYARGRHTYDSCSATGSTGGDSPIMTNRSLATGMHQAQNVMGQIRKHRPIKLQKDIMSSQKPADAC